MIALHRRGFDLVAAQWLIDIDWRTAHGLDIASDTANAERNECRHFGEWLARLEKLPPLREDN